ncbi:glutamate receptor 1-like [Palaemon carinicauda]|uniref:glutamate receptor 1-like n=1 Tax=Palaemon carinicauda TaxID=392227 RepID=UPI0035B66C5A
MAKGGVVGTTAYIIHSSYFEKPLDVSVYTERVKSFVPSLVGEMVTGPLREESVALVLEEEQDSEGYLSEDSLIGHIDRPITLLRPTRIPSYGELNTSNNTLKEEGGLVQDPVRVGVIVLVVTSENESWPLLQNPPENWNTTAVILISTSTSCKKKRLLQAPLLFRTPSVALLCPQAHRKFNSISKPLFRVWTWKPFVAGKQLVDLGTWNKKDFRTKRRLFIDRFDDMSEKTMQIFAQTVDRPLFYEDLEGQIKGINLKILQTMSSSLRFALNISAKFDVSWTEVLEPVKDGKNDIFINFSLMTPERMREYHMTVPYLMEGYGIMLEVPPLLPRWKNMLYPFEFYVWIATLVSVISMSITYHLIYQEYEKSFVINAISVFQCLLLNSMSTIPKLWRIRLFLFLWCVVSWILHICYTSNLIAVLTVPAFPKKIETMQELADSDYRLCVLDYGDPVPEALEISDHPDLAKLGRKIDRVPLDYTFFWGGIERCVYKVLNGTHAHLDFWSFIQIFYRILGHGSKTYRLKERLYPGYLVLLTYKHSPWKYKIDIELQRLTEAGLIKKWLADTMEDFKEYFSEEKSDGLQPFSLSHLQGPFYMYIGGVYISLMCFCGEYIFPRKIVMER